MENATDSLSDTILNPGNTTNYSYDMETGGKRFCLSAEDLKRLGLANTNIHV